MLTSTIIASTTAVSTAGAITTSAVSSSAAAGVITMTTPIGLPGYGVLAVIALIIFLISKELLSASEQQNMSVTCYLNMGISSLLLPFAAIVLFSTTAALSLT